VFIEANLISADIVADIHVKMGVGVVLALNAVNLVGAVD
jgi:hypothetical protein